MDTIRLERGETKGRYVLELPEGTAELTFSIMSPHRIIADHTGVPDALRGRGLADRLADRLAADARQSGTKITALCPFVRAWAARHPEWSDVFA